MTNTSTTSMDLEAAYTFLKTYHPELWERMDDDDILKLVAISHTMFKSMPELLDPTLYRRNFYTQ